jgi:hypothetical protein
MAILTEELRAHGHRVTSMPLRSPSTLTSHDPSERHQALTMRALLADALIVGDSR